MRLYDLQIDELIGSIVRDEDGVQGIVTRKFVDKEDGVLCVIITWLDGSILCDSYQEITHDVVWVG